MQFFNTVLLVDDDPTQTAVLNAYFKGIGVTTVYIAKDPVDGLRLLEQHKDTINLVVSDLQMPNMDGIEFFRHLKALNYEGKLAIFSGIDPKLLTHAARLASMHSLNLIGCLEKPVQKAKLDKVFQITQSETMTKPRPLEELTQADFQAAMHNGIIRPHYQPKVSIRQECIVGAESLARWVREDGAMVSPEVFITFAEETGQIDALTFHLFEKVLQDTQAFLRIDPRLKIAVNLSATLLTDITLPDRLKAAVNASGLSDSNISFEVTETSLLTSNPATLEVFSRLRIHGFEVAIDDFGTGFSNIQTLRNFPYSDLKIDRQFVSNAHSDPFSIEIVHTAVSLATQMGMTTVAEGIETMEDWRFAAGAGIDEAQGFLISAALDALSFFNFVRKHQSQPLFPVHNSAA